MNGFLMNGRIRAKHETIERQKGREKQRDLEEWNIH